MRGCLTAEAWAVGLLLRGGAHEGLTVYLGLTCAQRTQALSLH